MSDFDPADPPEKPLGRFQSAAIEMYEKLLNRGEEDTAEELRSKRSPSGMARFARQQVVEFDPKYDDDTYNVARITVKNVYDALLELGYEERAEELREFTGVQGARRRAREIADEIDAELDPVTGEFERPETENEGDVEA